MILKKIKDLFRQKDEGVKPPLSSMHVDIITGKMFKNADCICGTFDITKDISGAVIQLFPPNTILKDFNSSSFNNIQMRYAIVEISTEAKYDYKEISKWNLATLLPTTFMSGRERIEDLPSEVLCQVIVLIPSLSTKIDFENELVYKFFKEQLLHKSVIPDEERNNSLKEIGLQEPHEWCPIILRVAGFNLSLIVAYAYPFATTKIDENTHISYIVPENLPSDYKLKTFKFLPEQFRKRFLADIPWLYAEKLRVTEDKSHKVFIEQLDYINQMRKEFRGKLLKSG